MRRHRNLASMFNVYKITCPTGIVKPDSKYGDYIVNWRRGMCNRKWSMKMTESECVHRKIQKLLGLVN